MTKTITLEAIAASLIEKFEEDAKYNREFPDRQRLQAISEKYLETFLQESAMENANLTVDVNTISGTANQTIIDNYIVFQQRKKEILGTKTDRTYLKYLAGGATIGVFGGLLLFRLPPHISIVGGLFTGYIVKEIKDILDDNRIEKYRNYMLKSIRELEHDIKVKVAYKQYARTETK